MHYAGQEGYRLQNKKETARAEGRQGMRDALSFC